MKALKVILFGTGLVPLALLAWDGYAGNLGANPIETITRSTGSWTLIFLFCHARGDAAAPLVWLE